MRTLDKPTLVYCPHPELVEGVGELTPENAQNWPLGTVVRDGGQLWKAVLVGTGLEWAHVSVVISDAVLAAEAKLTRRGVLAVCVGVLIVVLAMVLPVVGVWAFAAGAVVVAVGAALVFLPRIAAARRPEHAALVSAEAARAILRERP